MVSKSLACTSREATLAIAVGRLCAMQLRRASIALLTAGTWDPGCMLPSGQAGTAVSACGGSFEQAAQGGSTWQASTVALGPCFSSLSLLAPETLAAAAAAGWNKTRFAPFRYAPIFLVVGSQPVPITAPSASLLAGLAPGSPANSNSLLAGGE